MITIEQIRYLALRRLGTRGRRCDKLHDCLECQVAIEFRKSGGVAPNGKYPPAKPGALGFEPCGLGAAYAAGFFIPKVNTIIAQTSAQLTGTIAGAKAAGIPVCLGSIPVLRTAQPYRARRTRPIGGFRC
jgi:hypothetical protein